MLLCDTALYILSLHCIPQHWMQPPGNHSCYLDDEDKMNKTEGNRKMGEPQTAKQTQKKVLLGQHKISFSGPVPLLSKLWSAAYLMRQKEKGEARHVCLCQPSITDTKKEGLPFPAQDSFSFSKLNLTKPASSPSGKNCRASRETRGRQTG